MILLQKILPFVRVKFDTNREMTKKKNKLIKPRDD